MYVCMYVCMYMYIVCNCINATNLEIRFCGFPLIKWSRIRIARLAIQASRELCGVYPWAEKGASMSLGLM